MSLAPDEPGGGPPRMADRSAGCRMLHVDMDCFYASVMLRSRPDLVDRPVFVGGAERGVVLSATYAARAAGVRSGMPTRQALRACPDAVVLPPDFEAFGQVSRAVLEIFARVTPEVQVLSLDEAFLDVAGAVRRLGTPLQIAERVRAAVWDEQRIACSVGVAPTPTVAKIATNRAKPDGILVVPPEDMVAFLHGLRVEEVYGVGPRTAAVLHRLGLETVADVAAMPLPPLEAALGRQTARRLSMLARGRDPRSLEAGRSQLRAERSMSNERTLPADVRDPGVMRRELLALGTKVAGRLRAAGQVGRTVGVRVRYDDFTTIARSRTLAEPTDVTHEVVATAYDLLAALEPLPRPVRLLGVSVEGLRPRGRLERQLVLGERAHGWADLDLAVDRATRRFGRSALRPATLVARDE